MSEQIATLSDADFESYVHEAKVPVLVDFWAPWCQPCRMIAPILEEIAKEYGSRIQIAKVNVDENSEIPVKYGIRNIPSLLLFKNGQMEASKVGALNKSLLTTFIESYL